MGIYKLTYIGNWFRKEIMFVNAENEYDAMTTALKRFPFTFKVKDVKIEKYSKKNQQKLIILRRNRKCHTQLIFY